MTNLKNNVGVFIDVVESKVCEGVGVEGCVVLTQCCKDGDPVGSLCDSVQCGCVMVGGKVEGEEQIELLAQFPSICMTTFHLTHTRSAFKDRCCSSGIFL